ERAVDVLARGGIPHFSRKGSYQVQGVLAGTRIVALSPWRILKLTHLAVIKKQKTLIESNRGSVLPDRCQAARRHPNCKFPQRRELVPLFRRISQDPFDRACIIIE